MLPIWDLQRLLVLYPYGIIGMMLGPEKLGLAVPYTHVFLGSACS